MFAYTNHPLVHHAPSPVPPGGSSYSYNNYSSYSSYGGMYGPYSSSYKPDHPNHMVITVTNQCMQRNPHYIPNSYYSEPYQSTNIGVPFVLAVPKNTPVTAGEVGGEGGLLLRSGQHIDRWW